MVKFEKCINFNQMHFIKAVFIFILFGSSFKFYSQDLPIVKSQILYSNVFSKETSKEWEETIELYEKLENGDVNFDNLSSFQQKMIDSLEMGYGPMSEGGGCSWYCGGGPYKITSSSNLKSQGNNSYLAENIHDFDLFTAWVPENRNSGIGEKINFYFEPFSPRVNEVRIFNGYMKNEDLWNQNSRVSKLKFSINNRPVAIFQLEDVSNTQTFQIDPIQSVDSTKDLILTFEILEVYPGSKYKDVAISEINFSGLDVHCFAKGTKILMSNFDQKNIEEIKENDSVMTFDFSLNQLKSVNVSDLIIAKHVNLFKIKFEGGEIIVTDDHPFFVNGKYWASINFRKTNSDYINEENVNELKLGDSLYFPVEKKYKSIISIDKIENKELTYTLNLPSGNNNFIANGCIVKTEISKYFGLK